MKGKIFTVLLAIALLLCCSAMLSFAAPFTDNGSTVTDVRTGLIWQKQDDGITRIWGEALSYCEGLNNLGGQSDWRLPNIIELESITDDSRYNPAIDPVFTGTKSSGYWSSTTIIYADYPDGAWNVHFYYGPVGDFGNSGKGNAMYVRCVRAGQSGSLDYVDHFTITDPNNNPIGNQTVNSPFSIKIIAKNANGNTVTSFNGWVTLSSNAGNVSPSSLYIANGLWGGNVIVYEDSSNIQLIASGAGVQGVSNQFSTTGQIASVGRIEGTVKDNRKNPLSGATVRLSYTENGADAYPSVQTDSLGNYHIDNITSGNYYIWTEYNGNSSNKKTNKFFAGWGTATWKLTIDLYQSTDIPVILVPGVMGSTHYTMAGKWANEPHLITKAYEDGDDLILHDPTQGWLIFNYSPGWLTLKETLTAKGLEENKNINIIDCPWDWRVPLEQAVGKYLKPCIEKAQDGDPTKPVNIIAHSMGGLLVREYIQGYSYNNEILNFSMVGTPNEGAPKAYYVWEGGDPEEVDGFYWDTTKILYEDTYQFGSVSYMEHRKLWNFIHDYVPTVRQLLPTYDFLDYKGTLQSITSTDNTNDFLDRLNSNNNRYALMGLPSSTGKVKTRIYYSVSKSTIQDIDILMNSDSFWTSFLELYGDGRPQKNTMGLGDETVPRSSAMLPCNEGWAECNAVTGKHAELIRVNADEITNDLYPSQVSALGIRSSAMAIVSDETTPLSNVYLSFQGRIQPYITDPQGRSLGVNASNGAIEKVIPDSEVNIDSNSGSLSIDNPVDGVYTVSLRGVYNEDYNFNIGYMDASGGKEIKYHDFNHANTTSFTFTVNSSAVDKITVNRTPLPPTGLQADTVNSSGLKTRLSWTANADAGVTGYNVYAKYIDEPYLSQIGTSATNSFDTGDAWAENASVVTSIYAVSAKKADGPESFLSNMVENNDRDYDGLTDEEETTLGTNVSNADSDGDGLKDGEEYVRGTNPLLVDTDGDGYSDYAEIQAGTDPLDVNSYPCKTKAYCPDLVVISVAVTPTKVVRESTIEVTDITKNRGKAPAGLSTTRYYLSKDNLKSKKDILLSDSSVQTLDAAASSPRTTTVTIPADTRPGSYYIIACADDTKQVKESKEGNNCSVSGKMIKVKKE